jgi:hypothetical protein
MRELLYADLSSASTRACAAVDTLEPIPESWFKAIDRRRVGGRADEQEPMCRLVWRQGVFIVLPMVS